MQLCQPLLAMISEVTVVVAVSAQFMPALVDNRQDMVEKRDVGRQLGVFVQVHREVKGPTSDTCVLVRDKFGCGDVSEM